MRAQKATTLKPLINAAFSNFMIIFNKNNKKATCCFYIKK